MALKNGTRPTVQMPRQAGRRSTGEVAEVGPRSVYVRFDSVEPTLIYFDDPEWMDYITFEAKGGKPQSAAEIEGEGKRRE
jgi:hypothetical protein